MLFISTVDSPLGVLNLASSPLGLCAIGLPSESGDSFLKRVCSKVHGDPVFDTSENRPYEEALRSYFEEGERSFDIPLDVSGTPFQLEVWSELKRIPYGETRTYGEIAAAIGKPLACRAVGAANSRNMIPIIIPCHRVIGRSGALVGFTGGLDYKARLLSHEGSIS